MVELAQAAVWHRQVAALAAAANRVGVAEADLPGVRSRLLTQQARFAEAVARTGVLLAPLAPSPTEIAAAAPALGDLSAVTVAETFRTSHSTLDAIDGVLAAHLAPAATPGQTPVASTATVTAPPGMSGWPAGRRNALVYGGYAFTVLLTQLLLLAMLDAEQTLPLLAPLCLLVLPAFAWAAGWFTVGLAFRAPPGGPTVKRTPRLGAVVCLLPNLLLCAGLGVLFLAR